MLITGNIPLKIKISNRSKDLFKEESTTAKDGKDENGLDLDKICSSDGGHIAYEYNAPKTIYRPSARKQFFKSRLCMYSNPSCCITYQLQNDSSVFRILLSGDMSLNPGPVRWPCSVCGKAVAINHRAIQFDICDKWCHMGRKRGDVSLKNYEKLMNDSINSLRWYCPPCTNQNLNHGQTETVQQYNIGAEGEQQQQEPIDRPGANEEPILERQLEQEIETTCYQNLKQNLSYEPKYLKVAHINVNGLLTRSKLQEVKILLSETKFDMLGITETKLSSRTGDEKLNIDG